MACLYTTTPNLVGLGPRITVKITASTALLKTLTDPVQIAKYAKGFSANMLIDTGASATMIDVAIAPFLGLKKHGTEKIVTPSSEKECLTYDVDITFTSHGNITLPNLRVIEGDFKARQGIDGLIGRDILKNGLLVYQGWAEQFTLAF